MVYWLSKQRTRMSMFVLAMLVLTMSVQSQKDQPAPYLFYYSRVANGFVIERADGTDSRLLAQGVMPDTHNEIHAPAWSPSGEWLTWRSGATGAPGPTLYSGWIISTDGRQRLTMLDHLAEVVVNVSVMDWAEQDDRLFVVETIGNASTSDAIMRYSLIDATEGIVNASYEFEVAGFWNDPVQYAWLPDGQGVVAYSRVWHDDRYELQSVVLLEDGTTNVETLAVLSAFGFSPQGSLVYVMADGETLVIQNPIDDTVHSFPMNKLSRTDRLSWNPQHNVAMYYMQQDERFDLWLLDLNANVFLPVAENVQLLTLPSPHYGGATSEFAGQWSPDGSRHLFQSADGNHLLFNLQNQSTSSLENLPDYDNIRWSDNGLQLILDVQEGNYVYDILSQEYTFIPQIDDPDNYSGYREGTVYSVSPDGNHIGLTSSHTMIDLEDGSATDFSPHSATTYATNYVSYYDWHRDGMWTIVAANVTFAGCCGPTALSVMRSDTSERRELTVRWGESAGWLPDHVIPHLADGQIESIIQQPAMTFRFHETVTGVTWSPDSERLAVLTISGDVSLRTINWPVTLFPAFTSDSGCRGIPYGGSCPINWDGHIIYAGTLGWDTELEQLVSLNNSDRFLCNDGDCVEQLHDLQSDDGRWLASVDDGNRIDVVDQNTGERIATFDLVFDLEWAGDRLILLADNSVIIFVPDRGETMTLPSTRARGFEDRFHTISVSPEASLIAGASYLNEIHVWDIETGELLHVLNWFAKAIAFSPDGQWLAAGNTDLLTLWNFSSE